MTISSPTRLEALFSKNVGRQIHAGDVVSLPVDVIMAHDATLALLIDEFTRLGCAVSASEQVMITCDHFAPPARIDWADLQRKVIDFSQARGLDLRMYQGICHQLLLEDPRVKPGSILVGADSHTTLAGAVGAFATGLGATDILACLATGETWFRVPESIGITLTGTPKPWVMGRDAALYLLGHFGESGAGYRALELRDRTTAGVSMDSRAAICCMATEMGAKAALFVPDAVTADFLDKRDGAAWTFPEDDATACAETLTIDLSELDSLVACPHSPANIADAREVSGTTLHQVYIGSCAGGRLEDFAMAAAMLAGRRVAPGLKVIAVPSSVTVMREAMRWGYIQSLLDAGVCVSNPSCGACGGIDKGVLGSGETALMTSTRNFQGRLGPRDSAVYLASTAVGAASALTGRITHPAEVWREVER
ncbi:MAG: Homoaconitase large subunit [bacterium ADurb.Bin429]|nr:MAG: Homoaconitase large subunit [bacterium ADurb.Bin429]